jgi:hypothetical protein
MLTALGGPGSNEHKSLLDILMYIGQRRLIGLQYRVQNYTGTLNHRLAHISTVKRTSTGPTKSCIKGPNGFQGDHLDIVVTI